MKKLSFDDIMYEYNFKQIIVNPKNRLYTRGDITVEKTTSTMSGKTCWNLTIGNTSHLLGVTKATLTKE